MFFHFQKHFFCARSNLLNLPYYPLFLSALSKPKPAIISEPSARGICKTTLQRKREFEWKLRINHLFALNIFVHRFDAFSGINTQTDPKPGTSILIKLNEHKMKIARVYPFKLVATPAFINAGKGSTLQKRK
ncbi:MAG: hypothetical protein B9S32_17270 [Verrucomicrobia bacterium Tous-C9LFEB]|nr:MAG: hypothetical protein B9S32_17270 [Verrucomicrobia bacterium Tous-C9LFEB]